MKKVEVELFADVVNSPVVRMPGRKFPGVVIQGDSLHILWVYARDLSKAASREQAEDANELLQRLSGFMAVYESALKAQGMRLPYNKTEH